MHLLPMLTENNFLLCSCPNWYEMTFIICSGTNSADYFYVYKALLIRKYINNCLQFHQKKKRLKHFFISHIFLRIFGGENNSSQHSSVVLQKQNKWIEYFFIYMKTFRWSESESVLKQARLKDIKTGLYGMHMTFLSLV